MPKLMMVGKRTANLLAKIRIGETEQTYVALGLQVIQMLWNI